MIHGTGGERYEAVTDQWAREFLNLELAPIAVVTATVILPLEAFVPDVSGLPEPGALRRLEHDPWQDPIHKQSLVDAITRAPRGSSLRRKLYLDLQEQRLEQVGSISHRLQSLSNQTNQASEAMRSRDHAQDRTWPWPLHETSLLQKTLHDMLD